MRFPSRRTTINTQEKKFRDISIATAAGANQVIPNTMALMDFNSDAAQHAPLSLIAQGTGDSNRIGRSVWVHSIHMKMLIVGVATSNTTEGEIPLRFKMVLDKEPCNADPTLNTVVTDTGNINSMRNLYYSRRYTVLLDKKMVLRPTSVWDSSANHVDTVNSHRWLDLSYKFKTPLRIEFSGTASTVADLSDKNIFFTIQALNPTPAVNIDASDSICRIRFTDNPGLIGPRYAAPVLGKRTRPWFNGQFRAKRLRGG